MRYWTLLYAIIAIFVLCYFIHFKALEMKFEFWGKLKVVAILNLALCDNNGICVNTRKTLWYGRFVFSFIWFIMKMLWGRKFNAFYLNSFSTNILLLYPLKTSENLRFSDVFRDYRSGTLVENWLISFLGWCTIGKYFSNWFCREKLAFLLIQHHRLHTAIPASKLKFCDWP